MSKKIIFQASIMLHGKENFRQLSPILFYPFDRPLTHKSSFFNIVYFWLNYFRG